MCPEVDRADPLAQSASERAHQAGVQAETASALTTPRGPAGPGFRTRNWSLEARDPRNRTLSGRGAMRDCVSWATGTTRRSRAGIWATWIGTSRRFTEAPPSSRDGCWGLAKAPWRNSTWITTSMNSRSDSTAGYPVPMACCSTACCSKPSRPTQSRAKRFSEAREPAELLGKAMRSKAPLSNHNMLWYVELSTQTSSRNSGIFAQETLSQNIVTA